MAIIKDMLREEMGRLIKMEKVYKDKIAELPKGSIRMKRIGNNTYPYLVYRDGLKVKTEYLKLDEGELHELRTKIAQRKKFESVLKEIRIDMKDIRKVIKD